MNPETINQLNQINKQFYTITAQEFDATRGQAWWGWRGLLTHLQSRPGPLKVLDVGCGNGRFGLFLAENYSEQITYHGIDNNEALLAYAETSLKDIPHLQAQLEMIDIVNQPLPAATYDLVVLFGVIHHIPAYQNRQTFIQQLARCVNPGGLLVFASWRFYEHERFQERIVPWDTLDLPLQVEKHDYLLDWRRGERALRYCHYVDDAEQQALEVASGLDLLERYRADGFSNDINAYSVLKAPLS